jgi:hypothetical protein
MNHDDIYNQYYSDMPREEFDRRVKGRPNHDDLKGAAVTAKNSLQLPSDVKPVVKGTKQEILELKKSGDIGPEKVIFTLDKDTAYAIDKKAVQTIYGGSITEAVNQTRRDLKKGGDKESSLLGYPNRQGLQPHETIDAAVSGEGAIITDLDQMKEEADKGNIIWAAEGRPEEALDKAQTVARRWKEIG